MIKKAIVISFTFFGLSLWALFNAHRTGKKQTDETANTIVQNAVVLELFTSQGCSSCPPADALLEKVKKEYPNTVFALSYHVDYWDYIGWKDPFGSEKHTDRQRRYAQKFNQSSIYTPELVVNGEEHFVGSDRSLLYTKIKEYENKASGGSISLKNVEAVANVVSFGYSLSGDLAGKRLRAVLVLDEKLTQVRRGENRNRTLRNSNIVIEEKYIDIEDPTGTATIKIPEKVLREDALTLMLILETENRDVVGASKKGILR